MRTASVSSLRANDEEKNIGHMYIGNIIRNSSRLCEFTDKGKLTCSDNRYHKHCLQEALHGVREESVWNRQYFMIS